MKFRKLAIPHMRDDQVTIEQTLPKRNILIRTGKAFARAGRSFVGAFKKKKTYVEIICSLLIILFIYTGLNKLLDYSIFKAQLKQSPFINPIAGFIAFTLPAGELLIALALLIKRTRLLGLYLSFFLMFLFTGYIYAMLNYSPYLPCSCGGILSAMSWNQHLIFNACFTTLTIIGVLLQNQIVSSRKNIL